MEVLPYPASYPLARFLSESSVELMDKWGREAFEAMLMLVAYIGYAEHCAVGGGPGNILKTFRMRSAGPLWAMYRKCAEATGSKWKIFPSFAEIIVSEEAKEIDKAVSAVASTKHGKRPEGLNYPRLLERTGNLIARGFAGKVFGYFEDGKRKPFSMNTFQGIFRNARGPSAPFIDIFECEGVENFPPEFVFVFDVEKGEGLSLFPLFTRGLDRQRSNFDSDFFIFDIVRGNDSEIALRAIQEREEVTLTKDSDFPELFGQLSIVLEQDQTVPLVNGVKLKSRRSEQ